MVSNCMSGDSCMTIHLSHRQQCLLHFNGVVDLIVYLFLPRLNSVFVWKCVTDGE